MATLAQIVETIADDGSRELKKAALDIVLRQAFADTARDRLKLAYGTLVAAAVTTHHDACFGPYIVHYPGHVPISC